MTAEPPSADMLSMILVMGVTGAGKSYFINKLANCEAVEVGDKLKSCTIRLEQTKHETKLTVI